MEERSCEKQEAMGRIGPARPCLDGASAEDISSSSLPPPLPSPEYIPSGHKLIIAPMDTTANGTSSATPPPAVSTAPGAVGSTLTPATASGPRKVLHSKRSFGTKHSLAHNRPVLDSPAYDASEEDNDPLTDDGASSISIHVSAPARGSGSASNNNSSRSAAAARATRPRHALAANVVSSDDGGIDSPTYDGDVESIITTRGLGRDTPSSSTRYASSIASTLTSPLLSSSVLQESDDPGATDDAPSAPELALPPSAIDSQTSRQEGATPALSNPALAPSEPAPASIAVQAFNPANLTPSDIQEYARACIAGTDPLGDSRKYRINLPPTGRPVRIYADGVYDLFHFGHALQLRQAKLAFAAPEGAPAHVVSGVHLLVGVNSDEQCDEHKNIPIMQHAERCVFPVQTSVLFSEVDFGLT